MRTFLFMLLAIGAAVGGFALYLRMQTPVHRGQRGEVIAPQAIDPNAETAGSMGPGDAPWVKVLDRLGRLSYRFRAKEIEPEQGGRIHVNAPEIEFFQYITDSKSGTGLTTRTQRIHMVGKTGTVEVQKGPQASSAGFEKGISGPPKRGILNDVTVRVYPNNSDKKTVKVTLVSPNLAFDNETYEITTHEYTRPDGVVVPADQVPIDATGDYEFKGKGLTVLWNDLDGRLELLEIAHGESLVIRDRELLGRSQLGGSGPLSPAPATRPASPLVSFGNLPLADEQGMPIRLVAKDKSAAARAGAKTQPAKAKKSPQAPYNAAFDENVRISQGEMNVSEVQLARADLMNLEFMASSGDKPATQPTTHPTSTPATRSPATAAPAVTPATAPAVPTTQPTTGPATTQVTTQPALVPVIVRWTGKLRVVPMEGPGGSVLPTPLLPGESVLRLVGTTAPVLLTRALDIVECTAADYFSSDGSAQVRGSDRFGQVVIRQLPDPAVKGSQPSTIVTDALHYSGTDRIAVLHGPSHANLPLPAPATRPTTGPATGPASQPVMAAATTQPMPMMDARWNREGRIYFKPSANGGNLEVDHVALEGNVDVKHPQLALKSQSLLLEFAPKSTIAANDDIPADSAAALSPMGSSPMSGSILKQVIATTDVWCDLTDSAGKIQTVTTDKLFVFTEQDEEGKLYPARILAAGTSHAFDLTQDLKAGNIEMALKPKASTRPTSQPVESAATGSIDSAAVELKSMRAWDHVAVRNAEGSTATGDRMEVNMVDDQPLAKLFGAPLAVVTDPKGSIVSGPVIDVDPKRNWAKITGKGSIRSVQSAATQPTTRPTTHSTTKPAAPPRIVDIDWERQAELVGEKNVIVVDGPVWVRSTDADGTQNVARGERARIDLIDKPTPATQPTTSQSTTTRPISTRPASTRPTTGPASPTGGLAGGMSFMKDKVVSAINLDEKVIVDSTLSDTTGVLRQLQVKSEKLRYETGGPATGAALGAPLAMGPSGTGRIIIPVAGTMLYRDHRSPTTRPSTGPASTQPAPPDQARGATAFQWSNSMVVDQPSKSATLDGSVVIVNRGDEPGALPVQVNADRAVALFEPRAAPTTKPAMAQNSEASGETNVQLKWLTLWGNMVATRDGATLNADRADYNPATGWMVAVGNGRNPAVFTDATGTSTVWADQIHWNTQNWLMRFVNVRGRTGSDANRTPPAPVPAAPARTIRK